MERWSHIAIGTVHREKEEEGVRVGVVDSAMRFGQGMT